MEPPETKQSDRIVHILTIVAYTIVGILLAPSFIGYFVILIPIYLYRWILIRFVAPRFPESVEGPVSTLGNLYATEFHPNTRNVKGTRCAIIANFGLEGDFSLEKLTEMIEQKSLQKDTNFPEFQQYIESWMGFMFWKRDNDFQLKNHVFSHEIRKDGSDQDSETFICNLIEKLLNKEFRWKRSPWEFHVVRNVKNSSLVSSSGTNGNLDKTLVIFRCHHSLADGFSLMYAIVEKLFDNNLKPQKSDSVSKSSSNEKTNSKVLSNCLLFPWNMFYVMGKSAHLIVKRGLPWYISNKKKSWWQIYSRSELIPMDKMTKIKNHFGVSFTAVILSAISAASSQVLKSCTNVKTIPLYSPLPLPNRPRKLTNHMSSTYIYLPLDLKMDMMSRLLKCEVEFLLAKQWPLPMMGDWVMQSLGTQPAWLGNYVSDNRMVPALVSSFPGPNDPFYVHYGEEKFEVLSFDFGVGGFPGIIGFGVMVLAYSGSIRLAMSAESAAMTREEMEMIKKSIDMEIDKLFEIATSKK